MVIVKMTEVCQLAGIIILKQLIAPELNAWHSFFKDGDAKATIAVECMAHEVLSMRFCTRCEHSGVGNAGRLKRFVLGI